MNDEATTRDLLREVFTRHRKRIMARGVPKEALSEERIRRLAHRTVQRMGWGSRIVQQVAAAVKRYLRWHIQRARRA